MTMERKYGLVLNKEHLYGYESMKVFLTEEEYEELYKRFEERRGADFDGVFD